ncbi:MAG: YidB family protein [Steroidobacteraceae bacterium]
MKSWVGTGPNPPVSGAQITQALGPGSIAQIAQQLGLDHGQAGNILAQVLPRT